jgi:tetratricopeptide (TPR) repeat protein
MATITGVVRYHVTGLPASVLSAVAIEATVRLICFGRMEGHSTGAGLDRPRALLRQWWSADLGEPSFLPDFVVTLGEASVVKAGLIKSDRTLAQAATCVAVVRALAERAQIQLPSLESTTVVGAFESDGTLSCSASALEILRALKGVGAQRLVGPFSATDAALQGISVQPTRNLPDLLRVALGDDPAGVIRLALEWLVLFDPETQGAEADLWREAERRATENLYVLAAWFDEVQQRLPRSQVIQATLTALKSLAMFQTGQDLQAPEHTVSALESAGYRLTAVWLLTRWSFLLRERRHEEADQCLERADEIQRILPLKETAPVLLHQVGRALYYQAHFAEALEKYWQGYGFLKQAAGKDDLWADFYNSAGKCFNDIYQFAMALELFERAREIRATLRQDDKLARTYGAMGETYWRLGDLETAERCCREDLRLSLQVDQLRNERRDEIRAKNYLANVLFAKGALDEADMLYRETEAYYRARFDAGNTNEFGNLIYSVEGLARIAAAREKWDEVARLDESHAELAGRILKPGDPAILPVALLRYLHALKWQRENHLIGTLTRLDEAEGWLGHLYQAERAMVVIEIIISEMTPYADMVVRASPRRLEVASAFLWSILEIMDKPEVAACFAPVRQEVEQGRGALGRKGQDLLARDRQRRQLLSSQFAAARTYLAADHWEEAIRILRAIQESVVFFRDLLRHVAL